MIRKLRIKVVIVLMTVFSLMLAEMLGLLIETTKNNLERENAEMLRSLALSPRHQVRPDETMEDENVRLPYFIIELDPEGNVVSTSGDYYDLTDGEMIAALLAKVESEKAEDSGTVPEYTLCYLKSTWPDGKVTFAFADNSFPEATISQLEKGCLIVGTLALLVFGVLSWLLAVWMVRPVEKAFRQQKQFISDASHELKTPLTVIMTNGQMLEDGSYSEKQRLQFVSSILQMAEQMRGLVESMLDLSRMENRPSAAGFSRVDLSELASDALLPFEPVFFEKGLTLSGEIEPGIAVKGDEQKLRRLMEIFLDNAQKYCLPNTETVLSLSSHGKTCTISVADEGEPIPAEEIKNIFKRFYRVDRARSMNHSYGLGLAIAEEIAREHKGKIWAESRDGKNIFSVQLPIRKD